MKIECTIKRPNGSRVELGKNLYHFKPLTDEHEAPHVCNVENPEHIKALLKVKCYVAVDKVPATVQKDLDAEKEKQAQADAESHLNSPEDMDEDIVSEETIDEILGELEDLLADKKKTSPELLTNKDISEFAETHLGISAKSKVEIQRYAIGCKIKLADHTTQPAALLKDLLTKLLAAHPADAEEEPEAEADEE